MQIATPQEILDKLEEIDTGELLDRMENYVRDRFYCDDETKRMGFDYLDFCVTVIRKACTGTRKWKKEEYTFDEFLFGCLKSDLYNFFRKQRKISKGTLKDDDDLEHEVESYIIDFDEFVDMGHLHDEDPPPDFDFDGVSEEALRSLKTQGADDKELGVFECWLLGVTNPREIADYMNTTSSEINNVVKRLNRKTIKIREAWQSLKN